MSTGPLWSSKSTPRWETIQGQTMPFHSQRTQELNVQEVLRLLISEIGIHLKYQLTSRESEATDPIKGPCMMHTMFLTNLIPMSGVLDG
jgi:hypothetical protein